MKTHILCCYSVKRRTIFPAKREVTILLTGRLKNFSLLGVGKLAFVFTKCTSVKTSNRGASQTMLSRLKV